MVEPMLGDELLEQIQSTSGVDLKEESTSASLKFDDKGSLHILKRDADGKLLEDIPVKEITYEPSHGDELRRDYLEAKEASRHQRSIVKALVYGTYILIGLGMILTAGVIFAIVK